MTAAQVFDEGEQRALINCSLTAKNIREFLWPVSLYLHRAMKLAGVEILEPGKAI
jgi:hypothetical protein